MTHYNAKIREYRVIEDFRVIYTTGIEREADAKIKELSVKNPDKFYERKKGYKGNKGYKRKVVNAIPTSGILTWSPRNNNTEKGSA